MSVEILDSEIIRRFVDDEQAFNASIDRHFVSLDTNHDGLLSFFEMGKVLTKMRVLEVPFGISGVEMNPNEIIELYHHIYEKVDREGDEKVNLEEFRAEMKEVLLDVAAGIGFLPVPMVVEEGSFLKMAVEREAASH